MAFKMPGGCGVPVSFRVLPDELLVHKPFVPLVGIEVPHIITPEGVHLTFNLDMLWLDVLAVAIERTLPLRCIRRMLKLLDL